MISLFEALDPPCRVFAPKQQFEESDHAPFPGDCNCEAATQTEADLVSTSLLHRLILEKRCYETAVGRHTCQHDSLRLRETRLCLICEMGAAMPSEPRMLVHMASIQCRKTPLRRIKLDRADEKHARVRKRQLETELSSSTGERDSQLA